MPDRPYYDRACKALQAAHDACMGHPGRDVLGMSHGPFSGVNEALGIVSELERKLAKYERPEAIRTGRGARRPLEHERMLP